MNTKFFFLLIVILSFLLYRIFRCKSNRENREKLLSKNICTLLNGEKQENIFNESDG